MIRDWPLVGRSEELQVIAQATRAADQARGIVLSGAAGVGKTRLAAEAVAACAPRDARRRWIVGTTSARGVPLGAFADIASDFGPDPLRRVREVINALIGNGQNRSVVVGVDDAHLLDDLSAFAVHQLVTRRLATVILTIRSGESPPDAITAIWKDLHLQRLQLQPLSLAETTGVVEHVLDGPVESLSARRLWQYTQGNMLYLRHLLENEVSAGRMTQHSGMWLWSGRPTLSPTLTDLLEARVAQVSPSVRHVLDTLAVTEPLDAEILARVADSDALSDAESFGLVTIDTRAQPAAVRLAHPMLGEIRRTNSLRLQRLRGQIATELAATPTTDPRDLVRRAVLTMESDLAPEPELLVAAASAAMQLMDASLAETLAERAVAAGGGLEARIARALAITQQQRAAEAETILADLANQTSGPVRAQIAIVRALNFATILGQVANAERVLAEALPAEDEPSQAIIDAFRVWSEVARGHSRVAVEQANRLLARSLPSDIAEYVSVMSVIFGLGDSGRIDEVKSVATRGYDVVDRPAEFSTLRVAMALVDAYAHRLAGLLVASDAAVRRMQDDIIDVPYVHSWRTFLAGMSAMNFGALAQAQRSLRESLAYLGTGDIGRVVKAIGGSWLAMVSGMLGDAAGARRDFESIRWWHAPDPDAVMWDMEKILAEAWVCAAEGATSQAISIVRGAASMEVELDRPAREVLCLQTATQFGDHTTAARLAELADQVQGPRAPAAAAHAAALAEANGDDLIEASRQYEAFGDRLAAADAAAQAVVAYNKVGRRGAALSASATAQRLAAECEGAQTPALRAAAMPLPFTDRQREIITLAAQGLSNKDVAERLSMSVRSVEGHLFRASHKAGVGSRDELIAILRGR